MSPVTVDAPKTELTPGGRQTVRVRCEVV